MTFDKKNCQKHSLKDAIKMLSDSQINVIFAFSNASIYEDHFYIVKFDERCNYDTKPFDVFTLTILFPPIFFIIS